MTAKTHTLRPADEGLFRAENTEFSLDLTNGLPHHPVFAIFRQNPPRHACVIFEHEGGRCIPRSFSRLTNVKKQIAHYARGNGVHAPWDTFSRKTWPYSAFFKVVIMLVVLVYDVVSGLLSGFDVVRFIVQFVVIILVVLLVVVVFTHKMCRFD